MNRAPARPRLGFLGVGWIGRHRLESILAADVAEVSAIADPSPEMSGAALAIAPGARQVDDLDALLALELDGIVIATPSAQHAAQSIAALQGGAAVFCQKPLGRTAEEVAAVVAAARAADRLLAVDLSYRCTEAMRQIRPLVRGGELGLIQGVDLVFHNAYGPDKPWFYDKARSGGGCVMDLGVHLVDLALWCLDFPAVAHTEASLFAGGRPLAQAPDTVEDYALATLTLAEGTVVRLACSWRLHAGRPAVIEATFHGTHGGAALRNLDGSFQDFVGERFNGVRTQVLSQPPDAWGGRAAVAWARRLARGEGFLDEADQLVAVARVLDGIYAAALTP